MSQTFVDKGKRCICLRTRETKPATDVGEQQHRKRSAIVLFFFLSIYLSCFFNTFVQPC